ncbi:MAG: acylphosphatase [Pseudanabaena sp. CRU_2_10]|nr:acylphosphatase [Pseudanabaena sp. CRU_2_10]
MIDSELPQKMHVHVLISGLVQGVGYRFSTASEARRRHLAGWVRNLSDGRVEAVFEGDRPDVVKMLEWCQHGPVGSVVKDVRAEYGAPGGLQSFEIRY